MDNQETLYRQERALCTVCPCFCGLLPGSVGICHLRKNIDGMVMPASSGRMMVHTGTVSNYFCGKPETPVAEHDGQLLVSDLSAGCCEDISDSTFINQHGMILTPPQFIDYVKDCAEKNGTPFDGILFTGFDPFYLPEYIIDTARMLHRENIRVAALTSGLVNERIARSLASCLDACVVTVPDFASNVNGDFDIAYKTIAALYEKNVYTELSVTARSAQIPAEDIIAAFARRIAVIDPQLPVVVDTSLPTRLFRPFLQNVITRDM